jgi:acyl-CoA reductase-like NAD-dependent aldehyde dehydrogenase
MTELVDAPAHPAGFNYVGGGWVPSASGETYAKVNPMRPSETTGEYSASSAADAEAAVSAAAAAFDGWAGLPMARRAGYLTAAAAGHNPLIVMADADLDRAVEATYAGAFWSAGQKCTATRRILVQDDVYDAFRAKLLARVEAGKVGDPLDPAVEVGPIVSESQFDEVVGAIERGQAEGGRVAAGGTRIGAEGWLVAPTVHVPFGGIKASGFGPHAQGRAAIEFYTETVTVYADA